MSLNERQQEFIRANIKKMTIAKIAKRIQISVKKTEDYIIENGLLGDDSIAIRHKLRKTLTWSQLKDEFYEEEINYFEEKYSQYMTQFKEDILVTEETQIFLVIKLEIMMHRIAKAKHGSSKDICRLVTTRDDFLKTFSSPSSMNQQDRDYVLGIDTQIQAHKSAESSRSNEFLKLEEKHQGLLKDLKATRDQRISRVESSKESFLAIIRKLHNDDEKDMAGRHMELMKKISKREMERLSKAHEYIDGVEDLPILNAETINGGQ